MFYLQNFETLKKKKKFCKISKKAKFIWSLYKAYRMMKVNFNRNKITTLKNLQRFLCKDLQFHRLLQDPIWKITTVCIFADCRRILFEKLQLPVFLRLLQVPIWKIATICIFTDSRRFLFEKLWLFAFL